MGTIKFLEGRIITEKEGIKDVWVMFGEKTNQFIVHNGISYHLKKDKIELEDSE